jgi:16S rRNA (guanine527-N7)-methyltransferase
MGDFVTSLIDIGTGGGFPAIPLAICFPKCKITAVDSIGKKTKFIDLVKDELKLNNLEIITARAEELAHDKSQREQYDLVVSRAVAELKVLLELTCPFAKVNSRLIAYKKFPIQEELLDAKKIISDLDLELEATETYLDDRQLLIFRKSSKTKSEYPRQMSKIKSKKVTKR